MRTARQLVLDWLGGGGPLPVGGRAYSQMELLDGLPGKAAVERYGALLSTDFLACETVKARALRSLPVHVMRKGDHGPEVVEDHPLSRAFRRPCALVPWGDLVAWAVLRRDTYGTAYLRVYRDRFGRVTELRPVLSHVAVSFDRATGIAVYSAPMDRFNEAWECREDDVVVLKTDVSEDGGATGASLAEKAAQDIGLSIDLVRFYRALLENGNHFTGYLEAEGRLDKADRDAVRASLDETRGPENAGKIRIFDRGLKYHEVSVRLEGMDIIEQEKWVLQKVCRACHVDSHHVFADEKAAATTAAGASIDFVKNTVLPEAKAIEDAFQPVLDRAASLGGADSGLYVKLNLEGLLRGDLQSRMEAYRIAVYAGLRPAKDICEAEDWPWYEGQQHLLQPTAYYRLDEDGAPYVPAAPTEGTSGQSDGQSGIDEKAVGDRLRALLTDACERVRKRAERDGDTPRTREFAHTAIDPVALLAAQLGEHVDVEGLIDEQIGGAQHARLVQDPA